LTFVTLEETNRKKGKGYEIIDPKAIQAEQDGI